MGIYATFAFITPFLLSHQFSSFSRQILKFEERIKFHFFLTSQKPSELFYPTENSTGINSVLDLISQSPQKIPSLLIFFICYTFQGFMGSFTDALVLVTTLSLWHPVKEFSQILQKSISKEFRADSEEISLSETITEYRKLKELSILINDAVQTVVFTFIAQAIFFYSIRLKEWFTNCGPGTPYLSFYFVSFFLIFYFAADICKQVSTYFTTGFYSLFDILVNKVDQFRLLIYQMEEKSLAGESTTNVMVLLHDLSSFPIGISGKGRYVINYSFVATVMA